MTTDAFAAGEQVRDFGEQAAEAGRVLSRQAIDAYDQFVQSAVQFERTAADAAPAAWLKTAIGAHASFVADVNAAYVGAVRSVLN